MPDGHRSKARQVELALHREEAVDVALRGELGGVVLDVHGDRRGSTCVLRLALHDRVSFKIIEA